MKYVPSMRVLWCRVIMRGRKKGKRSPEILGKEAHLGFRVCCGEIHMHTRSPALLPKIINELIHIYCVQQVPSRHSADISCYCYLPPSGYFPKCIHTAPETCQAFSYHMQGPGQFPVPGVLFPLPCLLPSAPSLPVSLVIPHSPLRDQLKLPLQGRPLTPLGRVNHSLLQ